VIKIAFQNDGRSVIQGVSNGSLRMYPFEAIFLEWQGRKEGGPGTEREHGSPEIMPEAG
jgi:hypothetical protein